MDKDLLKGLAIFIGVIAVLLGIFFIVDSSGPNKFQCVKDSLANGVPPANIKKVCRLVETRPGN